MRTPKFYLPVGISAIVLFSGARLFAQEFQLKEISERVGIVFNPDLGSQVVVRAEKGLVVFDSFWSEATADRFREAITKALDRDDFSYVINMADRLDMMGGNTAYRNAVIVGHGNIRAKYSDQERVKKEIGELIDMWREKEGYSRDRLQKLEAGSEEAIFEENWMNKCSTMAEELEQSFSLILPELVVEEQLALDLGDLSVDLFWFGETGEYRGLTLAVIPEEKLAVISKAIIYPRYHLAPYPFPYFGVLDVPRWIAVLEQVLEGEKPVDRILLSDGEEVYPRDLLLEHLKYIRELWNGVKDLEARGMTLPEIQQQLSLEREFSFVKEMELYRNSDDSRIRPQHEMHIKLFFLQGRILASQILREGGPESIKESRDKVHTLGGKVYFDEISMNFLGSEWMNKGMIDEAIEVFKMNAEAFPGSSDQYSILGSAYLKKGDTQNALSCFSRSLELDPDNRYALENLNALKLDK